MALSTERRGGAEGAKDEPQIDNHKYECMSSMEGRGWGTERGRGRRLVGGRKWAVKGCCWPGLLFTAGFQILWHNLSTLFSHCLWSLMSLVHLPVRALRTMGLLLVVGSEIASQLIVIDYLKV